MPTTRNRPDHDGTHRLAFERNKKKIYATQTVCGICGKPVDFSFKYPIKLETQYFGGIDNSRCTWSGIICPSNISTPFHLHKSRIYCCISTRNWL